MYGLKQYKFGQYEVHELFDTDSNSWMKVAAERGGIVLSLGLLGEELLFLNEQTFLDEGANVRGGIPILFPICGQLAGGEYELNGNTYKMKNHGVARNHPWQVAGTNTDSELSISLVLNSNDETKVSFPFDFQLNFKYVLERNRLSIHQQYVNKSTSEMPIYAGFHPYFKASHKNLDLETDAQHYHDYNDMQHKRFTGSLDLTGKKEALALLDASNNRVTFRPRETSRKISIESGSVFRYMVVWTEQGQDFICVEPWMAKTDELNRKYELVYIEPGQSLETVIRIAVE